MDNFKEIEPTDVCPPHLQGEIISEIDMIRNSLQVVQVYAGDFLGVLASLFSSSESQSPPTEKDA